MKHDAMLTSQKRGCMGSVGDLLSRERECEHEMRKVTNDGPAVLARLARCARNYRYGILVGKLSHLVLILYI